MCFIISCICVYYYDYLYVCYMLDIGERAIELMFSVYCHTDENKDYLSIYLSTQFTGSSAPVPYTLHVILMGSNWYSAYRSASRGKLL